MNKEEAKTILRRIHALFPNFNREKDKEVAMLWIEYLMDGDYEKTLRRLKEYAMESPYPPNVADIIVKKHTPERNIQAELIKEAEEIVRQERQDPEKRARREYLEAEIEKRLRRWSDD